MHPKQVSLLSHRGGPGPHTCGVQVHPHVRGRKHALDTVYFLLI